MNRGGKAESGKRKHGGVFGNEGFKVSMRVHKQMEARHEPFLSRSSRRQEAHFYPGAFVGKEIRALRHAQVYLVTRLRPTATVGKPRLQAWACIPHGRTGSSPANCKPPGRFMG